MAEKTLLEIAQEMNKKADEIIEELREMLATPAPTTDTRDETNIEGRE